MSASEITTIFLPPPPPIAILGKVTLLGSLVVQSQCRMKQTTPTVSPFVANERGIWRPAAAICRCNVVRLIRLPSSACVVLMLGQRRRRWPNIKPTQARICCSLYLAEAHRRIFDWDISPRWYTIVTMWCRISGVSPWTVISVKGRDKPLVL